MATITKSYTELQIIENITTGSQGVSDTLSPTSGLAATFFIDVAPQATNTAQTQIRIEASQESTGDDTWVPIEEFLTTSSTVNSNAVDGTEAAGQTVIEETTTTGLAAGQYVFFKNSTIGNSEWGRVISVSGSTSFTLQDGLTNAQTGATWYNQAERFVAHIDCTSLTRLRVVLNNAYDGTGTTAINWRVQAIEADSIG